MGYVYPSGGKAGSTVEVVLGGYNWTPDMQLFVLDGRVKLESTGPPGDVIVPEPPYWFGKKARQAPFPLPREMPAKFVIPAGMPPGIIRWQAANANGTTATGSFVVSSRPEVVEDKLLKAAAAGQSVRPLPKLPVTVSGRIQSIAEVDRYQFSIPKAGLVTCEVFARRIGSPLDAIVQIHNGSGRMVHDVAGTDGRDARLTFMANADEQYIASVYDVDFRGNRAYVYRLAITPDPQLVAVIPAAGVRGQSQTIKFLGIGIATGQARLEAVSQSVKFPSDANSQTFRYSLKTQFGNTQPIELSLADAPDMIEPADLSPVARLLKPNTSVTGVLDRRYGEDRYQFAAKKGEAWSLSAKSCRLDLPLDVSLTIFDADGKQLATNDDMPGTTDAGLEFRIPIDGTFTIVVSDGSGNSGNQAAVYRLTVAPAEPDFAISVPENLNVLIGGKVQLAVSVTRREGFAEPISLSIDGLPAGIKLPEMMVVTPKQKSLKLSLEAAADCAATAALAKVTATAKVGEKEVVRTSDSMLVAITMKPPYVIDAVGKDDVTKWYRGSTFPAPVTIARDEGFKGEIVLEMSARQGRHRQGINGPELVVPPGVERIEYPIFLPEWLETTRTSRMVVNGVAKVADPKGNQRYTVSKIATRLGFLPIAALLKISNSVDELTVHPSDTIDIPISIARLPVLKEPASLELRLDEGLKGALIAEPLVVPAGTEDTVFRIRQTGRADTITGEHVLTIRATVLQSGKFPVVSETAVIVNFSAAAR